MSKIKRVAAIVWLSAMVMSQANASGNPENMAFPETFKLRLSSYSINSASTDITVLSSAGVGAGVSFDKNLGGETSATLPRLDGYYRFNARHRIDFSIFNVDRTGRKTIDKEITLGDETFNVGDTIDSEIKYSLFRVGYGYSFYRSPSVELTVTAGLNVSEYDFKYGLSSGGDISTNGVTAPLPTFGLRMGYAIDEHWSVRYVSETFFIEIEDSLKGSVLNFELDLEYKFDSNFALGVGLVRTGTDLEARDSDWSGNIADSYRGYLLYGSYYF